MDSSTTIPSLEQLRNLWAFFANLQGVMAVLDTVPDNPFITYAQDTRPGGTECIMRRLTDKQCDRQVNGPLRAADAAAQFGWKVETIAVLTILFVIPISFNYINRTRPSGCQVRMHAIVALTWCAETINRAYLVYWRMPQSLHHCVNLVSMVVFGMQAICMWMALPPEYLADALKKMHGHIVDQKGELLQQKEELRQLTQQLTQNTDAMLLLLQKQQRMDCVPECDPDRFALGLN